MSIRSGYQSQRRELSKPLYKYRPISLPYSALEPTRRVEYWKIIKRRKATIALFAIVGMLLAVVSVLTDIPMYRSTLSLEIQGLNQDILNTRQLDPQATGDTSSQVYFNTQLRVLQSNPLAEKVTAALRAGVVPGDSVGSGTPRPYSNSQLSTETILRNLKVRSTEDSRIADITFESPDPQLAAAVPNVLAKQFIDYTLESRWASSQHTETWLNERVSEVKNKLDDAERNLQAYARSSGITLDSQAATDNAEEHSLRQLREELARARAERVIRQSVYESAAGAQLPSSAEIGPLAETKNRLGELRRQFAELNSNLTPEHYKVKRVQAEIVELEIREKQQEQLALKRIRQEYEISERRENLLSSLGSGQAEVVRDHAGQIVHYNNLKHEVDSDRTLYETMMQKVKEYSIASALRASNARVIQPASVPTVPFKPKVPLSVAAGLSGGCVLGLLWVLAREASNNTIRRPGQLASVFTAPELGAIPSAPRTVSLSLLKRQASSDGSLPASRGFSRHVYRDIALISWNQKTSAFAESFRTTAASLLLPKRGRYSPQIIVLTSLGESDGKTTVTSNLAIALAERYPRVLVIDGDRRHPRLSSILGPGNEVGLSSLLENGIDDASLDQAIQKTPVDNLYILQSGPPARNQSLLLSPNKIEALLGKLRKRFDLVLIDTSPVLAVSDARIIAGAADGVVLVVKAGMTTPELLTAAQDRLSQDGTPLIGVILNNWNSREKGAGYYSAEPYLNTFTDKAISLINHRPVV